MALQCLHRLQETDMNLDILTKTGVGILINTLRKKSTNTEVTTLGKQLIKQWKKLVPDSAPTSGGKRSPPASGDDSLQSAPSESKRIRRPPPDDEDQGSNHTPFTSKPSESENKGYFVSKAHDTDDPVRLKAREMIKKALDNKRVWFRVTLILTLSKSPPPGAFESGYLATEIESAIFNIFKDNGSKYKQRIRTRVMNLNDEKNPDLRLNVFMGHVKPERLANMTSEEMASKDMKLLREKFIKETIDDHQMALTSGTQSGLLTCGKCKQKNCTYNQVQTRSADEPMTTFVYCNNCGNRWKVG
ncbi:unnamed protein product [Hymenolepis diminuta]|uniref:Transcription elongation factor n=1 Tax=Hymenolepis diminuta TaxID=6216 RepID=A0A3P6ZBD7_HYMDI|nr:unnamed protein product [Hymenolepis diminuta]